MIQVYDGDGVDPRQRGRALYVLRAYRSSKLQFYEGRNSVGSPLFCSDRADARVMDIETAETMSGPLAREINQHVYIDKVSR